MSQLTIYEDIAPFETVQSTTTASLISTLLAKVGVRFERWEATQDIVAGDDQAKVLNAYAAPIAQLKETEGYTTADVVSLTASHPDKAMFRAKFLSEHTHSEDEVRFFVAGRGLFSLHIDSKVYAVLCEKGDLISVPDGTTHWFDMGTEPEFTCIRVFTNPDGWVADFTGNDIAAHIPNMDTYQ